MHYEDNRLGSWEIRNFFQIWLIANILDPSIVNSYVKLSEILIERFLTSCCNMLKLLLDYLFQELLQFLIWTGFPYKFLFLFISNPSNQVKTEWF